MNEDTRDKVGRSFSEVLEKLAFMFAEPAEADELPAAEGKLVLVAMGFSGHWRGRLELAVPEEMSAELAANVLGLDAGDEAALERSADALKELLNVACGSILTTLAGDQPVFDLSVPKVAALPPEAWAAMRDDPETLRFVLEDRPALLRLHVQEGPA
mgnify:CR=1 FL=1